MSCPPAVGKIGSHILRHLKRGASPLFVAIQGPQGSGKSFLTALVKSYLSDSPHSLRVATLSIDDLYLPHDGLKTLADEYPDNPLWRGRGQPGTHDIVLGSRILESLKKGGEVIELPRFDKSLFDGEGDRLPLDGTGVVVQPPTDVVIVEGWCTGFYPISDTEVKARWDGVWEEQKAKLGIDDSIVGTIENIKQVNEMLHRYVYLWSFFDVCIQLSPAALPDNVSPYSIIYIWRLEQEHYMKAKNGGKGMTDAAVKLFVDRYIPGYVFFGNGVTEGYGGANILLPSPRSVGVDGVDKNTVTAAQCEPRWRGRGLRLVLDAQRNVVEESEPRLSVALVIGYSGNSIERFEPHEMSAYGAIKRVNSMILPCTAWRSKNRTLVTIHHLDLSAAQLLPGLIGYLGGVFAKEVEDGRTYPQEGPIDIDSFQKYFFAADVLVAIKGDDFDGYQDAAEVQIGIEQARNGRPWEECVAGYYYVKPNYPGRSSHICNGGFVVPPIHRGAGYGSLLAKSYLHYAPKLGYRASVFNLVYVNNAASVKLWERLGFTKVGRIPHAGRLKTADGKGEEYMDAWVIYKSFVDDEGNSVNDGGVAK
uniref:N-acetyltransferase domain-containing protein n=1 Tax=Moniliophthora roreri TaxID=221103 RepID=A0A0W0F105_MONRR